MGKCKKCVDKYGKHLYLVFRVLLGLMFLQHGGQKLFGWFGGVAGDSVSVVLFSTIGLAGFLEFFGGLMVLLGLFSRLVAPILSLLMLVAYFMAHLPTNWNITSNGGELALMYFISFLVVSVYGNGKWNLEQVLLKKELF